MQTKSSSLKHPSGNQYNIMMVLVACFFCLTGCYENTDNSKTETTETEFPQITNDGFLIGSVVSNGEPVTDYTIELNNEVYDVDSKFYLELERVNKLFQPLAFYKDGELLAFAVTPMLADEVNLVEIEAISRSESLQPASGFGTIEVSSLLNLSIDGSDPINTNLGQVDFYLLNKDIGYSGTKDNVTRFVLNHLDAFILEADAENLKAQLQFSGYSLASNLGLFQLNEETSNWSLLTEINQTEGTLTLETDGIYSIAEYVLGVIVEGKVGHQGDQLGFVELDIANASLSSSYRHRSTGSGKYIAFVEQDADASIALDDCGSLTNEQITTMNEDRSDVNLYYEDFNGSPYSLNAKVINCSNSQVTTAIAQLVGNGNTLPLPNNQNVSVAACADVDYAITVDLVDNNEWSLPWDDAIVDPYIFLPNCEGVTDGYGYLQINGENKYYETFTRDNTITDEILLTSVEGEFQIRLRDNKLGNYETEQVGLIMEDVDFGVAGYAINCGTSLQGCGIDYCQVTHLDSEWLRVSFAGEVWMQTLQTLNAGNYTVEGNIVIKL